MRANAEALIHTCYKSPLITDIGRCAAEERRKTQSHYQHKSKKCKHYTHLFCVDDTFDVFPQNRADT